jgi:hypothetical protein
VSLCDPFTANALPASIKASETITILENSENFITAPFDFPEKRREPAGGGPHQVAANLLFLADGLQFSAWG